MMLHKLDGMNYLAWSEFVRLYITGKGKLGYLTGNKPQPEATDPTFTNWVEENAMLMTWFLQTMTLDVSTGYMRLPTAKDIWDTAAQTYSVGSNDAQIYDLKRRTHETTQKGKSLFAYFTALQALWQELDYYQPCEMKCADDIALFLKRIEKERTFEFLAGLNPEFNQVRIQVFSKIPIPSLREVYAHVRAEELRRTVMLLPTSQKDKLWDVFPLLELENLHESLPETEDVQNIMEEDGEDMQHIVTRPSHSLEPYLQVYSRREKAPLDHPHDQSSTPVTDHPRHINMVYSSYSNRGLKPNFWSKAIKVLV
ncbi:hypothetical protein F0562_020026 [Nyssa sinensis]|uniref:Retrotransposon Copia-like N-terminal domain-containing protein n=1 Tax=Nyssa sinensis TaxID=561372 RepID=A0A5J5BUD1_9ASTE|nr:hypothetical protein F0562_020026 [Nyssa sinensis]